MLLTFETGHLHEDNTYYTCLTESDDENTYNVYVDVKYCELFWNGWDPDFKVVSVTIKKFVYSRLTEEKTFLAILHEDAGDYFIIPNKLIRKENLKV